MAVARHTVRSEAAMNTEESPATITITPPFVAAAQFDEFVAFLSALGYQVVTTQPGADGFGGDCDREGDGGLARPLEEGARLACC